MKPFTQEWHRQHSALRFAADEASDRYVSGVHVREALAALAAFYRESGVRFDRYNHLIAVRH